MAAGLFPAMQVLAPTAPCVGAFPFALSCRRRASTVGCGGEYKLIRAEAGPLPEYGKIERGRCGARSLAVNASSSSSIFSLDVADPTQSRAQRVKATSVRGLVFVFVDQLKAAFEQLDDLTFRLWPYVARLRQARQQALNDRVKVGGR